MSLVAAWPRAAGADASVAEPAASWDPQRVEPQGRHRVHLAAADVPLPGEDDPALRDPRRWPAMRTIEGALCSLRVQLVIGESLVRVASLDEVPPGSAFGLCYEGPPWLGWASTRGLHSMWSGSGALIESYWLDPDSLRDVVTGYQYYESGALLRYYHRTDSKDPLWSDPEGPYEWFEEFFDTAGNLLGYGYSKMRADRERDLACHWAGEPVGYDEFQARKRELYTRAFP